MTKYLEIAEALSHTSESTQKHGAVIVSGGKILAQGVNSGLYSGKKLLKMYGPSRRQQSVVLHAEATAILELLATQPSYWSLRGGGSERKGEGSSAKTRPICRPIWVSNEQALRRVLRFP